MVLQTYFYGNECTSYNTFSELFQQLCFSPQCCYSCVLVGFDSDILSGLQSISEIVDKKLVYINLHRLPTMDDYLSVLRKELNIFKTGATDLRRAFQSSQYIFVLDVPEDLDYYDSFDTYTRGMLGICRGNIAVILKQTELPNLPEVEMAKLQGFCFNVYKE